MDDYNFILYEGFEQWAVGHGWLNVETESEGEPKYIWLAPSGRVLAVIVKGERVIRVREAKYKE